MVATNPLVDALVKKKISLPDSLHSLRELEFQFYKESEEVKEIKGSFPHTHGQSYLKLEKGKPNSESKRVGVVFSGGQAPGGHNVLLGLQEALKKLHPDSKLLGFLKGPSGFLKQDYIELTDKVVTAYQNLGGFDLLGSGRTKIETKEQFKQALKSAQDLKLDGFVVIGGDDSNTNAALIAEYFKSEGQPTTVVGVPKTIDGDLKNEFVEVSFGFDTASKVYSELIGNILIDARSSQKYYHFIKLMGRSASHLTLECALKTNPNLIFIGENIKAENTSLSEIVDTITELVIERSELGKNYGVLLIPEGLIDFIPEIALLNKEINASLAKDDSLNHETVVQKLSSKAQKTFASLPLNIQKQLLLERDPHGNIQLAKIETQKLLMTLVGKRLKDNSSYSGKYSPIPHYLGYEGRCAHPSPFDAEYTYALGYGAALLVDQGYTGYMASIKNLNREVDVWELFGVPITSLLHIEKRHGKEKPVIKKALVDLKDGPYLSYLKKEKEWRVQDEYNSPGPIQYFGSSKVTQIKNSLVEADS